MDRLLNRVSLVLAPISTVALLHLVSRSSLSCTPALTAHGGPSKNPTPPPAVFFIDFHHPLIRRADPHNLPFFDDVFDLACSADLAVALFLARFVCEMERTVRPGGTVVLSVDYSVSAEELAGIHALFKRSRILQVRKASILGSEVKLIIMKKNWKMSS